MDRGLLGGGCGRRGCGPAATRGRGGLRRLEEKSEARDRRGRRRGGRLRLRCMLNLCQIRLRGLLLERCRNGLLGGLARSTLSCLARGGRCHISWRIRHISGRISGCFGPISGRTSHIGTDQISGRLMRRAGLLRGLAWGPFGRSLLRRSSDVTGDIGFDVGTKNVVVVRCHLGRLPVTHVARATPWPIGPHRRMVRGRCRLPR